MNRIILKSGSPIHFSRVVRRTMSFKFPESALWSVSQLGLLGDNENVIGSSELDHLAKLSSVDISVSNVSRDEILNDLNAMLRCAKSLRRGGASADSEVSDKLHSSITLNDSKLCVDEAVADCTPDEIFSNTRLKMKKHSGEVYFAVCEKSE